MNRPEQPPAPSTARYLATAARGLAPLLRDELVAFGATDTREEGNAVSFTADVAALYRSLIGSRIASRILRPVAAFSDPTADACLEAARAVDWSQHMGLSDRFRIDVAGSSPGIAHTRHAGLRVKDGIADAFRAATGSRPDVDTRDPSVRVLLLLRGSGAQIAIDVAGGALHRRGYRAQAHEAPLRENLAAALLMRAGWPAMVADDPSGATLLDPFCGSGTLVIEAALMATHTAPGLLRWRDGALPDGWRGHDAEAWRQAMAAARADVRPWQGPPLRGSDLNSAAISTARHNARTAGVQACTQFETADALTLSAPAENGLLIANPPFGERLGTQPEMVKLYSLLGEHLKRAFGGWHVALLMAEDSDSQRLGLRASARHRVFNGALACNLVQFDIAQREDAAPAPMAAEDFANRLAKNRKHLDKWARRREVSCYRLYHADLKEYPLLVDRYQAENGEVHLHVQEFAAPASIDAARAERRLRGALDACVRVLELPPSRLHYKLRRTQKGSAQYQASDTAAATRFVVTEHGCRLRVDLDSYLDTGLFLDHRPLRLRLQQESTGLRVLNLYCYTASASVHAARGGARQTVSVDTSNTYLGWARDNFALNGIKSEVQDGRSGPIRGQHALLRADCLRWLARAAESGERFDRIFCDPPTFSNSKRDDQDFDVQRDHVALIRAALAVLADDGSLYFSTNRRRFRIDDEALQDVAVQDITAQTLDEDCKRPPPVHRCWQIRHGGH